MMDVAVKQDKTYTQTTLTQHFQPGTSGDQQHRTVPKEIGGGDEEFGQLCEQVSAALGPTECY